MTFWRWLLGADTGTDTRASETWLKAHAVTDMRETWQGPRWHTPREVAAIRKADRRERGGLRVVGRR